MRREPASWGEGRPDKSLSKDEKLGLITEVIRLGREISGLVRGGTEATPASAGLRQAIQIIAHLGRLAPHELVLMVEEMAPPEELGRMQIELSRSEQRGELPRRGHRVEELFEAIERAVRACLDAKEGERALGLTDHLEALIERGYLDLRLISALSQLGIPMAEQGRLEEAEELLSRVARLLKRHPDLATARRYETCTKINLGYVLFLRGKREEAELELRTLLTDLKGMDAEQTGMVLIQLAYFKMLEGLPQQALSIMRSVEECGSLPSDPFARRNALIFQALVETAAGSPSKAKHILTTLLAEPIRHMEEELRSLLAIVDWKLGLKEREELLAEQIRLGGLEPFRHQLMGGEGGEESPPYAC